ncbi:MAG: hypothetical protein AAF500_18490, partial [Myxococcota bacterium]
MKALLFLLFACLTLAGCEPRASSPPRQVIVIGIDGLGSDALQAASTPNLDALIASGTASMAAFAGGVPGTPTEQ